MGSQLRGTANTQTRVKSSQMQGKRKTRKWVMRVKRVRKKSREAAKRRKRKLRERETSQRVMA